MSSNEQSSPIASMSLESMSITDHQKAKLKELFPEVFTEGSKIDFDKLKRTLGETVDAGKERFGMNWAGKADCFKTIQQPSVATLVPARDESVDFDTTENVFIEGDNLEVLKLLQKSYLGKIKMIYIDPPYNTGNDFIYPDNYSENLDTYLEYTGQIDGEGRKFSTNVDTDGRFHSKWMNMMYPRLFLAKNLLREDGVIFISIDDNEIKNLRSLCDEIFGEENFAAQIPWQARQSIQNDTDISESHEYILAYARARRQENRRLKETNFTKWFKEESFAFLPKALDETRFENPDNDPRGKWKADPFDAPNLRPNLTYPIKNPNTGESYMPPTGRHWRTSEDEYNKLLADKRIIFGKTGNSKPQLKVFFSEKKDFGSTIDTWFDGSIYGTATKGTKIVQGLFDGKSPFDTVKPIELIQKLSQYSVIDNNNDIILDFFAGSATTAHAIMDLNKADGGNRKYICVQLPEPINENNEAFKDGFKTIADISKERIRRAAAKIKAESNDDLLTKDKAPLDLGFRVFKLKQSNFKVWDSTLTQDPQAIQLALDSHIDHINPDASQEDILFELLLKAGFQLTTPIETLTLAGKTVFSIADNALLICLEKELTLDVMKAIAEREPARVIVLDEGFQNNDQLKTNAALTMKSKGVLDFRTV